MSLKVTILFRACALAALVAAPLSAAESRPLALDDLSAIRDVFDPTISPDGQWVAYTVRRREVEKDRRDSDIWMTRWDGGQSVRLTSSKDNETMARWSPDGRYLAFLSDRDYEPETDQVWILNRAGGEAERLTDFKGGVTDFAWSPDGRRLALVVSDPDPDAPEPGDKDKDEEKTKKPIVIDRFQFKEDYTGYLGTPREHLVLFDLERRSSEALTTGRFNEYLPSWSPDGKSIAFVTKRGADFDRHDNWDIYIVAAQAGADPRQLTTHEGSDCDPNWKSRPAWSPDGRSIAYFRGGDPKLIYYSTQHLALIPAGGGAGRLVAPELDRSAEQPVWSPDGSALLFLFEDDGSKFLGRVPAGGGVVERLSSAGRVVEAFDTGPDGKIAILSGTPHQPLEVFALEGGALRALSRQNESWLEKVRLGAVQEIQFPSRDGTEIHGFVIQPPDFEPGRRYPTLLRIHGGPVGQFANEFDFQFQLFAARGYLVLAANPRGSSGRGEAFATAIYADWGHQDTQDVLAAVDYAVAQGWADPERLGIGGWSYGGMLTNYVIAQDTRFKAATSGASISNILAGYGTDQYIKEYEHELGVPWKNLDAWLKVSFPFLHADRIVTPTLFACGQKDFNVPLLNSEQMYQALRSLGVETQLVIYPDQYHGLRKPSYERDLMERYLSWYDKYLMPPAAD